MNKGMLTVGIILLSLISLLLINVITNYSTGGELDYYLVKETTDAAMEDAIDYVFLRTCGLYRIDKEKFVESFVYRFVCNRTLHHLKHGTYLRILQIKRDRDHEVCRCYKQLHQIALYHRRRDRRIVQRSVLMGNNDARL